MNALWSGPRAVETRPYRKVMSIKYYKLAHTARRYGGGQEITLECGHKLYRKQSTGTPRKCRCIQCEVTQR